MNTYTHSVSLDSSKCTGCTTCLRHCPTEAIRVKNGRAEINADRCIDCGECIRICPHNAKKAVCSKLSDMDRYKYKIALPAPTLYGQFEELNDVDYVLQGLIDMGFDQVYEVSRAAELVSEYTRKYLETDGIKKPVISSACPVITRLITLRFPYLKDNLMTLLPPMEIAAKRARRRVLSEHPDLKAEDIGVCFISPCPAKASYVKNGFGSYVSAVDCVVSISDIYFELLNHMKRELPVNTISRSGVIGISWATSGGEAAALFNEKFLAADGIENCIKVLDQIESGAIPNLEFVELNACTGGCVGGVLTMENPFIAKARLQTLRRYLPVSQNYHEGRDFIPEDSFFEDVPEYKPMNRLADSIGESMRMMAKMQSIRETLPGTDCGACGAPNCRALAEDIVKGERTIDSCVIMKLKTLTEGETDDSKSS